MTIPFSDIEDLVADYKAALACKIAADILVLDYAVKVEILQSRILQIAYEDKMIVGKNADIRKHEERVCLADNDMCQGALARLTEAQVIANAATVEFKTQELLTSLTRAWLYAQRPELP